MFADDAKLYAHIKPKEDELMLQKYCQFCGLDWQMAHEVKWTLLFDMKSDNG